MATRLRCRGCGTEPGPDAPWAFTCPNASSSDDTDHVLARLIDGADVELIADDDANPFVRYRQMWHSWHVWRAQGRDDTDYVRLVRGLDEAIAEVAGSGFGVTPFASQPKLAAAMGMGPDRVWVKDETGNVAGSHKARHLMGVMIWIRVATELGLVDPATSPRLAVTSCGNAALAAAVVAGAAGSALDVFIPTWTGESVVAELEERRATIAVCERQNGEVGDPCYRRFQEAVVAGSVPFTCQGSENGLSIEGGHTLAYEMAERLARDELSLDAVVVQVGGGALATACIDGLTEAVTAGLLPAMPRVYAVQTEGGYALARAYDRIAARVGDGVPVADALAYASTHRSEFMWPWETEPQSLADGILDDETYDWLAVVGGIASSGGDVAVVSEERVRAANELGRAATGIDVDHTGTAGLAGLLRLRDRGLVGDDERVAVLFTGVRR